MDGHFSLCSLMLSDLDAIANVHLGAFPKSAITALGHDAARRYYAWQLSGPHDAIAFGALEKESVVGFAFGGVFRGALSGFIRANRSFLLWNIAKRPWIAFQFQETIEMGWSALFRRPSKNAPTEALTIKSFGVLAIAVLPKYQGYGLGTQLMGALERVARERSFERMHLTVQTENSQAIHFYERLGWVKLAEDGLWKGRMVKYLE